MQPRLHDHVRQPIRRNRALRLSTSPPIGSCSESTLINGLLGSPPGLAVQRMRRGLVATPGCARRRTARGAGVQLIGPRTPWQWSRSTGFKSENSVALAAEANNYDRHRELGAESGTQLETIRTRKLQG